MALMFLSTGADCNGKIVKDPSNNSVDYTASRSIDKAAFARLAQNAEISLQGTSFLFKRIALWCMKI
jgi:hypothetical protein